MKTLYIKICGITRADQATAIAALGVQALGFIGVAASPRYVTPKQMQDLIQDLPPEVDKVGVFQDLEIPKIADIVASSGLTAVQLHGQESPQQCEQLGQLCPWIKRIKGLRIRQVSDLDEITRYRQSVEQVLLDAYHPHQAGGTGLTLNWSWLQSIQWSQPWLLAGGLNPENIQQALSLTDPTGVDVSSGVEIAPGVKDLERVRQFVDRIRQQR